MDNRGHRIMLSRWKASGFKTFDNEPDPMFVKAFEAAWDSQQAEIDSLMQEYCPNKITPEQWIEWEKHQIIVQRPKDGNKLLVEPNKIKCKKPNCSGSMQPGKAIQETFTGSSDFPGGEVITLSAGGPGKLIDCLKCNVCGYSVTI